LGQLGHPGLQAEPVGRESRSLGWGEEDRERQRFGMDVTTDCRAVSVRPHVPRSQDVDELDDASTWTWEVRLRVKAIPLVCPRPSQAWSSDVDVSTTASVEAGRAVRPCGRRACRLVVAAQVPPKVLDPATAARRSWVRAAAYSDPQRNHSEERESTGSDSPCPSAN